MTQDEFYKYLEEGAEVMTSQPSPDILMKAWREQLAEYDEIVYIPMSSGLSSSAVPQLCFLLKKNLKIKYL